MLRIQVCCNMCINSICGYNVLQFKSFSDIIIFKYLGGKKMSTDKATFINLMINSINQDNRDICQRGGMANDEIEKSIEQSQPSLAYMAENLYNRLVEGKILKD